MLPRDIGEEEVTTSPQIKDVEPVTETVDLGKVDSDADLPPTFIDIVYDVKSVISDEPPPDEQREKEHAKELESPLNEVRIAHDYHVIVTEGEIDAIEKSVVEEGPLSLDTFDVEGKSVDDPKRQMGEANETSVTSSTDISIYPTEPDADVITSDVSGEPVDLTTLDIRDDIREDIRDDIREDIRDDIREESVNEQTGSLEVSSAATIIDVVYTADDTAQKKEETSLEDYRFTVTRDEESVDIVKNVVVRDNEVVIEPTVETDSRIAESKANWQVGVEETDHDATRSLQEVTVKDLDEVRPEDSKNDYSIEKVSRQKTLVIIETSGEMATEPDTAHQEDTSSKIASICVDEVNAEQLSLSQSYAEKTSSEVTLEKESTQKKPDGQVEIIVEDTGSVMSDSLNLPEKTDHLHDIEKWVSTVSPSFDVTKQLPSFIEQKNPTQIDIVWTKAPDKVKRVHSTKGAKPVVKSDDVMKRSNSMNASNVARARIPVVSRQTKIEEILSQPWITVEKTTTPISSRRDSQSSVTSTSIDIFWQSTVKKPKHGPADENIDFDSLEKIIQGKEQSYTRKNLKLDFSEAANQPIADHDDVPAEESDDLMPTKFDSTASLFSHARSNRLFMTYPSLNFGNVATAADDSSESSESDDMGEDQFEGWLDTEPNLPTVETKKSHGHTLRVDSHSLQRLSPLPSRKFITVKPRNVAKTIFDIKQGPPKDIKSFKQFMKDTEIADGVSEEEAFFIYCYLYDHNRYGFIAHVNKDDEMVSIKAVQKRGNRITLKTDLDVKEIDQRLNHIAVHGKESVVKSAASFRDTIPYTRLEHDDSVLEDFIPKLQSKLANSVTVGKWFILLSEIRDENIKSFEQFVSKYYQLNHLSEHEKFLIYALVYGQDKWKLGLETISTELDDDSEKIGVYCTLHEPEFLREYDDMSDIVVRNKLINIAMNDPLTRKQLLRAGFKLPMKEAPAEISEVVISYEALDILDDVMDEDCVVLSRLSAQPRRIAELLSKWCSLPNQRIDTFEGFKRGYSQLGECSEFERFVVYASIYKNYKWKLLFEINKSSGLTTLRLHLRHSNVESDSYISEYDDPTILEWLTLSEDVDQIAQWLTESGFIIPISNSLVNRNRIDRIPGSLSAWSKELNTFPTDSFKLFTGLHPEIKELSYAEQVVLFIHAGGFQEWELIVHPVLLSSFDARFSAERRSLSNSSTSSTVQSNIFDREDHVTEEQPDEPRQSRRKKVSYAGDIKDMQIDPFEISHLITIIEKDNYQGEIYTFDEFCGKYSMKLAFPSQKQMYALYCYYYGKSMRKIISDAEKGDYPGMSPEAFNAQERPHANITPEAVARRISRIEESSTVLNLSSIDEFKQSVPDLDYMSEAEKYLLYCYFYGRSVWNVVLEPSAPGVNVTLLKRRQRTMKTRPSTSPGQLRITSQARRSRKVSYAGHIKDMAIDPSDISRFIPILERDVSLIDISTYEKFKKRYTPMFVDASEKEMFALYCYYYGRSIRQMMNDAESTGIHPDINVLAKALHSQEVPHSNIIPENIARKMKTIEGEGVYFDCSSLETFLESHPEIKQSSESEQYLLYCYFYGRSVWNVTIEPTFDETYEKRGHGGDTVLPTMKEITPLTTTITSLPTARQMSRKKKVSFAGNINDIAINPSEISHLIPILERHGGTARIKTYEEFKDRYSSLLNATSEKELYALYCYHYGKTLRELVNDHGIGETHDVTVVSKALHSHEIPHTNIVPEKVARKISRMETSGKHLNTETMDDFLECIPDLEDMSEAEQYMLYCFFYGRSVWNVTVEPSTTGESAVSVVRKSSKSRGRSLSPVSEGRKMVDIEEKEELVIPQQNVLVDIKEEIVHDVATTSTPVDASRTENIQQTFTTDIVKADEDGSVKSQSVKSFGQDIIKVTTESNRDRKLSDGSQASSKIIDIQIPSDAKGSARKKKRLSKSRSFTQGYDVVVADTKGVSRPPVSLPATSSKPIELPVERKPSIETKQPRVSETSDKSKPVSEGFARSRKLSDQSQASSKIIDIQIPVDAKGSVRSRRKLSDKSESFSYDVHRKSDASSVPQGADKGSVRSRKSLSKSQSFTNETTHPTKGYDVETTYTRKTVEYPGVSGKSSEEILVDVKEASRQRKLSEESQASSKVFDVQIPVDAKGSIRSRRKLSSKSRSLSYDVASSSETSSGAHVPEPKPALRKTKVNVVRNLSMDDSKEYEGDVYVQRYYKQIREDSTES